MTSCDGCGLPPRIQSNGSTDGDSSSKTTTIIPLKKCTRCRQASYHDVQCQRKHYHVHRRTCRPHSTVPLDSALFVVKERHNQKYLVASQPLGPGQPVVSKSGAPYFLPLIPPVLFTSCRTTRCAVCFRDAQRSGMILISSDSYYSVTLCSEVCRLSSNDWLPREVAVVRSVFGNASVPPAAQLLPTALLAYRLLQTNIESWPELLAMQSHDSTTSTLADSEAAMAHQHAVIFLLHHLLAKTDGWAAKIAQGSSGTSVFQSSDNGDSLLLQLLNRIKINAFAITDRNVSVGLGVYESPSYRMNHSCDYNAIQSFTYTEGAAPRLSVLVCRPISAGDEICISYIDSLDAPVNVRREMLARDYCFHCRCSRCDKEDEAVE